MSSKVLFRLSGFALLVALPLQVLGYVLRGILHLIAQG